MVAKKKKKRGKSKDELSMGRAFWLKNGDFDLV